MTLPVLMGEAASSLGTGFRSDATATARPRRLCDARKTLEGWKLGDDLDIAFPGTRVATLGLVPIIDSGTGGTP